VGEAFATGVAEPPRFVNTVVTMQPDLEEQR
jgi:hypothetical protein